MDILKTAREIGFFETARNVAPLIHSRDVRSKAGASMPLPALNADSVIDSAADWLLGFGKNKFLFFSPEIAILEALAAKSLCNTETLIAVPCDMDADIKERLKNNLPNNIKTSLLEEPYFPERFFPMNGIMVVCGYLGNERPMILPETYRMLEHYSGFMGKKVFLPYTVTQDAARFSGWLETNADKFYKIFDAVRDTEAESTTMLTANAVAGNTLKLNF